MPPQNSDHVQWFAEELQPYEHRLRAHLQQRFPTLDDIDDVVQESYLKVLRRKMDGNLRSARGLFFTIARNLAFDTFRRRRRAPFVRDEANAAPFVAEDRPGVVETACLDQELALLAEAIAALPPRCREILTLRKIHGLSHKEIARRLGVSERLVNHDVGHGVRRCAAFLQARGVDVGKELQAS
jgi:RNA polymerase sigma-70 factor (ECF subfamily)